MSAGELPGRPVADRESLRVVLPSNTETEWLEIAGQTWTVVLKDAGMIYATVDVLDDAGELVHQLSPNSAGIRLGDYGRGWYCTAEVVS